MSCIEWNDRHGQLIRASHGVLHVRMTGDVAATLIFKWAESDEFVRGAESRGARNCEEYRLVTTRLSKADYHDIGAPFKAYVTRIRQDDNRGRFVKPFHEDSIAHRAAIIPACPDRTPHCYAHTTLVYAMIHYILGFVLVLILVFVLVFLAWLAWFLASLTCA